MLSLYIFEQIQKELEDKVFGESTSSISDRFENGFNSCLNLIDEVIKWYDKGKNPQFKNFFRRNPDSTPKDILEFYLKEIKKEGKL